MEKNKVSVQRYNLDYLQGCVMSGKLIDGEVYTFNVCDRHGNHDGITIEYNIKTGHIKKVNEGKELFIGDVSDSEDKVGYVNFLIYTPFCSKVHDINSASNSVNWDGIPVARQWTVYAHMIGCVVKCVMNRTYIDTSKVFEVNHKDGCKFHNYISNLELTYKQENGYHGAVLTSILHSDRQSRDFGVYVLSNKLYDFPVLGLELSANDIIAYMKLNMTFAKEVKECYKSISKRNNKGNIDYISCRSLMMFRSYLDRQNKINLKRGA